MPYGSFDDIYLGMSSPFRMTKQSYLILLALAGGRAHGYAMIKQVADLSGGDVKLGAGTLYGNLDRLLEAGFVEPAGEETVAGRARRYYKITDDGAQAARTETLRLAQLAAEAKTILDRLPGGIQGSPA